MFKSHLGVIQGELACVAHVRMVPKGSSRLLVRGASSNTSSVYSREHSGFQNLGWDSYNSNGCARSNRTTIKNEEEEEDKKVELPSKRPHVEGAAAAAAPKSDAILVLETSIAKLALEVDALKDELKVAKAEVAKWSGKKFNSPPETDMSQTNEALKFYTEQAAAAQTALDKEKDRLDKANAQLLEEKRFLDNEQKRQHDFAWPL
ncbi:hypothetical protein BASA81_006237 [Batrachochytrium salamandrivorans]|nr:hypothetical protein BASA81_006237 [Batrachochytrium salamandrivorans]